MKEKSAEAKLGHDSGRTSPDARMQKTSPSRRTGSGKSEMPLTFPGARTDELRSVSANGKTGSVKLETPPTIFTEAILDGGRRIREEERRKRMLWRTAAAAAACVALVVIGFSAGRMWIPPTEDAVLTESPSNAALKDVWAHPEDGFYHAGTECPLCREDAVLLERTTAEEFEKQPCGECMK